MHYCFDIDGTICTNRDTVRKEKNDNTISYMDMEPWQDRIDHINALYEKGHRITMWTGRGCRTYKDNPEFWKPQTAEQLKKWGVNYHELIVGKPFFDVYICDKSYNSDAWFPISEALNGDAL